jgi:hypothetical protein
MARETGEPATSGVTGRDMDRTIKRNLGPFGGRFSIARSLEVQGEKFHPLEGGNYLPSASIASRTHARTAHIHQLAGFERPELSRPHLPEVLREQILRVPHLLPRSAAAAIAAALSLLTLPRDWIVASRDEQNGVRVQFCIAELISEIPIDETR